MPIGRHPLLGVADDVDSLLEKALGRLHMKIFSLTASISQEVASTPGLGLSSDASS
jgi:hypothetical protein